MSSNTGSIAKKIITKNIYENPLLIDDSCGKIKIELIGPGNAEKTAALYARAYERGDWFGDNYEHPGETVLNPEWMEKINRDPRYLWIVFKEDETVLGATSLIELGGKINTLSIDETQLDPETGRKKGIMTNYFRRFVPLLKENGVSLSTYFVLTRESKPLREVLLDELGMIPIGIHPGSLVSRYTGEKRSEISAIWHPHPLSPNAVLIPEALDVYNLVRDQMNLPEAAVYGKKNPGKPWVHKRYVENRVDAAEPGEQRDFYDMGFRPVGFNPISNVLVMSIYPRSGLDEIEFIREEKTEPNKRLLDYINSISK